MKTHIAAGKGELYWRYAAPTEFSGAKRLLLTVGGIAVVGRWEGKVGQFYEAWCPLPKKERKVENGQIKYARDLVGIDEQSAALAVLAMASTDWASIAEVAKELATTASNIASHALRQQRNVG